MGNFTRLRELDLSNNNLEDLTIQPHIFDLPANLTIIRLRNNRIRRLNFTAFAQKTPAFELIDLSGNQLQEFPRNLVQLLRNGSQIMFSGNPLYCDCKVRPLQHYLWEQNHLDDDQMGIRCQAPKFNENQTLYTAMDESLQCIGQGNETVQGSDQDYWDFEKLPDVRFRDVIL